MTMILRRLTAASLAGLLACTGALAQDNPPSPAPATPPATPQLQAPAGEVPPTASLPELTLAECVTRALQKNFDVEIGRYNPDIAKEGITVAKGGFETLLTVTGTTGNTTTGATAVTPNYSADSSDLRAGVSQRLYSGTTVGVSTSLARSSSNPPIDVLNPAYTSDLTLSIRQSLLKGFGTAVNKAGVERAQIGFSRANLDFKTVALNVIQSTENAYNALAGARELLTVRKLALTLANRLRDEAKVRLDAGVSTQLDVLSAEVGVANASRNVLLAEQGAMDRQDALLALIGQSEFEVPVGSVRLAEVIEATPVFASSYQMAKQNQPDYLSSLAAIDQYKLDLKIAKDSAKPDLSVGAALGVNGRNGTGGDAINDTFDRQNHNWQVDFAFNYPWGQPSDKARYRQTLATLNREQVRLRQIDQTIEIDVRTAIRSVETNLDGVKFATLSAQLSLKQYELEKAKFDSGQSTSYRVLLTQNDLETAKVNELQAKVTLQFAISALHRLEGSTLQRYSIVLP